MLIVLTDIRSTIDGHYPITTFSIIVHEFGSQKFLPDWNVALISLNIVKDIIELDELDEGNISGRRPSVEDKLWWKTTFGGR